MFCSQSYITDYSTNTRIIQYPTVWYPLSTLHTVMHVGRSYTHHNIPYLTIHWELDCHWKCNMAHSLSRTADILHTSVHAPSLPTSDLESALTLTHYFNVSWHTYTWCMIRIRIGIFNPLPAADSCVLSCTGTVPASLFVCPVFITTDNGITDWRGWGLIESSPNTHTTCMISYCTLHPLDIVYCIDTVGQLELHSSQMFKYVWMQSFIHGVRALYLCVTLCYVILLVPVPGETMCTTRIIIIPWTSMMHEECPYFPRMT